MKKMNISSLIGYAVFAFLLLSGCQQAQTEILLEAEANTGTSGEFEILSLESGEEAVLVQPGGWLSFDLPVELAGRYKVQVHLASVSGEKLSCWIEDYYTNTDGRTYNISGSLELPSSEEAGDYVSLHRDGSPLNMGSHPVKLHVLGGEAAVDWIKFTLIKERQPTPEVLSQNMDGSEWVLAWSDEFDTDGLPDESKWTYDIGNWGWGNNELQYYTVARAENARVENGNLIIEARKDDMGEKWTSARLTTREKTSFIYGKIEFRAKVPKERGNWAAGWTLGDSYVDELSWPYCGEIDIMECVGYEINDTTGNGLHHASVHCGAYYFKLNNQPTGITEVKNMNDDYHLYAVEWTPDYIKAYVDDLQYFTYEDTSDTLTWPFNKPQNIILNLAMGGGWGGAQGMDGNVVSQQLVVDYVRVYERK
jgi:beta-glucanase (GH16 family)